MQLLDEGNTVPFITRYRKERTGNLNEEQIRAIQERVVSLRQLVDRAADILRLIDGQGKLNSRITGRNRTGRFAEALGRPVSAVSAKRRSRATIARERGLEPLAEAIWNQALTAAGLRTAGRGVCATGSGTADADAALAGARRYHCRKDLGTTRMCVRNVGTSRVKPGNCRLSGPKAADQTHPEFRDYSIMASRSPRCRRTGSWR